MAMHEHIARTLYYFQVHLVYASVVWVAAWALTSTWRGSATTKYWIWVVTALNFIVPTGAILDKVEAAHLSWATPLSTIGDVAGGISRGSTAIAFGLVWLLGATLMFARLGLRLRADHRGAHAPASQTPVDSRLSLRAHGVPVRFLESRRAPAVDGVLRPHISLPNGIERVLSVHELDAVLLHEVTHARRHDNLIRLIYEVALCALWFHPLVWITGSRLALYRELSCDEPVIQSDHAEDLLSALAKLANPEEAFLLQASASSFISHRLARLAAVQPTRISRAASLLLTLLFSAALMGGVLGTVAHTACCFVTRK
jgi:beta-lactamase regulating signal transducer with metallopeptidase domain